MKISVFAVLFVLASSGVLASNIQKKEKGKGNQQGPLAKEDKTYPNLRAVEPNSMQTSQQTTQDFDPFLPNRPAPLEHPVQQGDLPTMSLPSTENEDDKHQVAIVVVQNGQAYFVSDAEKKIEEATSLMMDLQTGKESDAQANEMRLRISKMLASSNVTLTAPPSQGGEVNMGTIDYKALAFALIYGQGQLPRNQVDFIRNPGTVSFNGSFFYSLAVSFVKEIETLKAARDLALRHGSILNSPKSDSTLSTTLIIVTVIVALVCLGGAAALIYRNRRREPTHTDELALSDNKMMKF